MTELGLQAIRTAGHAQKGQPFPPGPSWKRCDDEGSGQCIVRRARVVAPAGAKGRGQALTGVGLALMVAVKRVEADITVPTRVAMVPEGREGNTAGQAAGRTRPGWVGWTVAQEAQALTHMPG